MFDTVLDIFGSAGEIAVLDEALLNPVIGVNASSPAFFFRMIKAMVNSAVSMGVPEETALSLAAKTMMGSAKMLLSTKKTPDELISQVTSEGGTTYAALTAFDQLGFDELIEEAMRRCTKRAYELSK